MTASSTVDSLLAGGTSARPESDVNAIWSPALVGPDGQPVPGGVAYRMINASDPDEGPVTIPPNGLSFIWGDEPHDGLPRLGEVGMHRRTGWQLPGDLGVPGLLSGWRDEHPAHQLQRYRLLGPDEGPRRRAWPYVRAGQPEGPHVLARGRRSTATCRTSRCRASA